jgi:hypothetical protein
MAIGKRIMGVFRGGKGKGAADKGKEDDTKQQHLEKGVNTGVSVVEKLKGTRLTALGIRPLLNGIRLRYSLGILEPIVQDGKWAIHGELQRMTEKTSKDAEEEKKRQPWQVTNEGSDRIASHSRFGSFHRSKSTGLWWSRDTEGHGGSIWKVFEERRDGLHWIADADEFGDFIEGKHKGPTGLFIARNELKMRDLQ